MTSRPERPTRLAFDAAAAEAHLARVDPRLGRVMAERGPYAPSSAAAPDVFHSLMRAIVYQQLSGKAAGTIHTDFERGFIKAEVYNWDDWNEHVNLEDHEAGKAAEVKVKETGKYRQEGKGYVCKDADIIFFKFNVTADAKKK